MSKLFDKITAAREAAIDSSNAAAKAEDALDAAFDTLDGVAGDVGGLVEFSKKFAVPGGYILSEAELGSLLATAYVAGAMS